jgi:hypothetical protein
MNTQAAPFIQNHVNWCWATAAKIVGLAYCAKYGQAQALPTGQAERKERGSMTKIAAILLGALFLTTLGGCTTMKPEPTEKKEIWEIWEEAQYNSYKPRLDHMIEKYGDYFKMNMYGTITSDVYPDWNIGVDYDSTKKVFRDNFSIYLRKADLANAMQELAEPIFEECKAYIEEGRKSSLGLDSLVEEFFTYQYGLVSFRIYVPYTDDYKERTDQFLSTIAEKTYKVWSLVIVFMDQDTLATMEPLEWMEYYSYDADLARCRILLSSEQYNGEFEMEWMEGEG